MGRTRAQRYDAVITGSGFAGANLALLLARAGKRVLVLEAGPGLETTHRDLVERYMLSTTKSPSAPYPPTARRIRAARTRRVRR